MIPDFNHIKRAEWNALAPLYDLLWPRTDDFEFYRRHARCQGSPVLEIGCGTGRLCIHLAGEGLKVVGVDLSPEQIRQAETRRGALPENHRQHLSFFIQDSAEFCRSGEFALAIAAFSTMFEVGGSEARVRIFLRVLENLRPGGLFAMDSSFHGSGELADWGRSRAAGVRQWFRTFRTPWDSTYEVSCYETQVYSDDLMVMTIELEPSAPAAFDLPTRYTVTRHYAAPGQITAELREAGFCNIELYGGFSHERFGDPAINGRGRQVFLARKRS